MEHPPLQHQAVLQLLEQPKCHPGQVLHVVSHPAGQGLPTKGLPHPEEELVIGLEITVQVVGVRRLAQQQVLEV